MNVILFGASGMIGRGVLDECLADPAVVRVLSVGRSRCDLTHAKLREIVHADLLDVGAIEADLSSHDACFFCLGVSSMGISEAAYRRVTYDMTLAVASVLARLNPGIVFVYVSGAGSDESGQSRMMWARVKGETEAALARLPFRRAYAMRPGFVQPMGGIRSRTAWYNWVYGLTRPFHGALGRLLPDSVTSTTAVGRAMLVLAKTGAPAWIIENRDINVLAATALSRR